MRNMNHITRQTWKKAVALLIATLIGASATSYATITVLTGGDAGEGYAPGLLGTVYAYDVTGFNLGDVTYSVQGVPFVNWALIDDGNTAPGNPSVTVFGAGQYDALATPTFGGSANDIALGNILHTGWFASGPLTLTLGGLTIGTSYQVDVLVQSNNDVRQEDFTFTGATVATDNFATAPGVSYVVSESLAPNALGQIVVTLTGAGNPFINGFSVTVPEPSTLALLAVGGLLIRRRSR